MKPLEYTAETFHMMRDPYAWARITSTINDIDPEKLWPSLKVAIKELPTQSDPDRFEMDVMATLLLVLRIARERGCQTNLRLKPVSRATEEPAQ